MNQDDIALQIVIEILAARVGEESGITIEELRRAAGLKLRREMEILLELHIQDIPFLVVSGPTGYYRPANADEINHCLNSLRSRAMCAFLRQRKIIRAARAAGFPRQGRKFLDPPTPDTRLPAADLFEYAERNIREHVEHPQAVRRLRRSVAQGQVRRIRVSV